MDDCVNVNHFATGRNEYLEWLTNKGRTLVVTATAATLTSAKEKLYENIDVIDFKNKKYRTDICN